MLVAVFKAWHTAASLGRVTHVERLTVATLRALRVVVALCANIQVVRAGTIAVTIAVAEYGTVEPNVTKVALALIWSHTLALITSFGTDRLTHRVPIASTTSSSTAAVAADGIALLADALKAIGCVDALLPLSIAGVVSVGALIFRGPHKVVPVHFTPKCLKPVGHIGRQRMTMQEDGSWPTRSTCGAPVPSTHTEAPSIGTWGMQTTPATSWVTQTMGCLAMNVAGHSTCFHRSTENLSTRSSFTSQAHIAGGHAFRQGRAPAALVPTTFTSCTSKAITTRSVLAAALWAGPRRVRLHGETRRIFQCFPHTGPVKDWTNVHSVAKFT